MKAEYRANMKTAITVFHFFDQINATWALTVLLPPDGVGQFGTYLEVECKKPIEKLGTSGSNDVFFDAEAKKGIPKG